MLSGDGPANAMPALATALAKFEFSDRKPYPGIIASTWFCFAISMI
jgi:hypothetical protein